MVTVPTTPQSKPQSLQPPLAPDTLSVPRLTSQSGYCTGDLTEGRRAVIEDFRRYLEVPFKTLVRSAFGPLPEVSQIRRNLEGSLDPLHDRKIHESKIFEPLGNVISQILQKVSSPHSYSFAANPQATPSSSRGNTSRPDAYITVPAQVPRKDDKPHWFEIAVPFEFKKDDNDKARKDNLQKIVWSLHNIMREDPLRRFAFGIMVEGTNMRVCYSSRAFLAVSQPIDFTDIDDMVSLFALIGSRTPEGLGWDPTVKHVFEGDKVKHYVFTIGGKRFATISELATYGADAMVGRGTRVYKAMDEEGNVVAIKDSWRDEDRDSEGAILEHIFRDIQAKLGEASARDAEKYFVGVQTYEDVVVSGKTDKTLIPENADNAKWIIIDGFTRLSQSRHSSSTGDVPISDSWHPKLRAPPQGDKIPRRIHTRIVFNDVGDPLMDVRSLAECFSCLSHAQQGLYYLHKANWVHRDFSVTNVLWVCKKDNPPMGKLSDLEYAKKVDSNVSHDVRTGTMHFMAVEVARQRYLFSPALPESEDILSSHSSTDTQSQFLKLEDTIFSIAYPNGLLGDSSLPPPFRMNFLHDLESHWWAAMWILLYYTDADSPTENPEAQQKYFDKAFPPLINSAERFDFFDTLEPVRALAALSETYKVQCRRIPLLAALLKLMYQKAEKNFPDLSICEDHLDDAHNIVKTAYHTVLVGLNGSNIRLEPLHKVLSRSKRELAGSPTRQAGKRARRG